MNHISTTTSIHPHDAKMELDINPMPHLGTTVFKIQFNGIANGVNIFLNTTPEELLSLLEEQVANLRSTYITETNTDSDESEELTTFADKFNASPIGLVVNNILNK